MKFYNCHFGKMKACGFEEKQPLPNKSTNCCFCRNLKENVLLSVQHPPQGKQTLPLIFKVYLISPSHYRVKNKMDFDTTVEE